MCVCPMARQHSPGVSSQARVSKLLARRGSDRTLATAEKPPAKCWVTIIPGPWNLSGTWSRMCSSWPGSREGTPWEHGDG